MKNNEDEDEITNLDDFQQINFNKYLKGPDSIMVSVEKLMLKHKITMKSFRVDGKNIVKLIITEILNNVIENCLKMNSFYKTDQKYILKNYEITEIVLKKLIVEKSKKEIIELIKIYKKLILLNFTSDILKQQKQKSIDTIKDKTDRLLIIDASLNFIRPKLIEQTYFRIEQLSRQGEIKAEMYKNLNQLNMDEFNESDKWDEIIEKNMDLRKSYQDRLEQIEDDKEFIKHNADEEDRAYKDLERGFKVALKNRNDKRKDVIEYWLLTQKMNRENIESLNETSQEIHDKLIAAQDQATDTVVSEIKNSFNQLDKGIDKIDQSIGKVDKSIDNVNKGIDKVNESVVKSADKTIEAINNLNSEVQNITAGVNDLTSKVEDVAIEIDKLRDDIISAISGMSPQTMSSRASIQGQSIQGQSIPGQVWNLGKSLASATASLASATASTTASLASATASAAASVIADTLVAKGLADPPHRGSHPGHTQFANQRGYPNSNQLGYRGVQGR
jgi:uncharacterized phage infection (PIP) family protein YhgE